MPAKYEFEAQWRALGTDVTGTLTGIGSGKQNTEIIITKLAEFGVTNKAAAQRCAKLSFNGYDDWFLPSKDELHLMYTKLHKKGVGGFFYNTYWSSSQKGDYDASAYSFEDGSETDNSKDTTKGVRPCRAF